MENFLQIFTLGKLELYLNGQPLAEFPTRKVDALLVYLAYTAKPHSREHLADIFWEERNHSQALSNLRTNLSRLNQQLADFLLVTRRDVSVRPDANIWLDALELFNLDITISENQVVVYRSPQDLEKLVALYRGDFLEDVYLRDSRGFEDWLHEQRLFLAKKLSLCLMYLVNYYLESGEYTQGIQHVQRLLKLDPTNELAYRQHMQLLAQTGQRSAALAVYERCRQILAAELHTEPETLTTQLYQNILNGAVISTVRTQLNPLAIPVTQFLGREAELGRIRQQLSRDDCRLLTVLGLGGIGKTRIAYQIAQDLQTTFQHGVCFLSFADIANPELFIPRLAEALVFTLRSPKNPRQQLLNYLKDKELLLILDNCEHLDQTTLLLIGDMLREARRMKILATSRERLNLEMESILPLEGLPYPADIHENYPENYPAVQLFIQTAQRLNSQFNPDDSAAIVRICQFVMGMPLAIELAATWTRQLAIDAIIRHLEDNTALLNSPLRDIPERHRNMEMMFEKSWRMLSPEAQLASMRISIFRGQVSAEAAREVCGISPEQLTYLVEKSFIQPNKSGIYRIHELVRRFTVNKLQQAGQYEALMDQHARYFLEKLRPLASYQNQRTELSHTQQVHLDYPNFSAALEWAYQSQNLELLSEFIQGLSTYWETNFIVTEALFWIQRAMAAITPETPAIVQARILIYGGVFSQHEVDVEPAIRYLEQGIILARQNPDGKRLFRAFYALGQIRLRQGNYEAARQIYHELLEAAERAEEEYWIGRAHNSLAGLALELEENEVARQHLEVALEIYKRLNIVHLGALLGHLGLLAYAEKKFSEAEYYFTESLAIVRKNNEKFNIVANLTNLGEIATETGRYEVAIENYLDAFAIALHLTNRAKQFDCLEGLCSVLVETGYHEFAALLLASVAAQREAYNLAFSPYKQAKYQKMLDTLRDRFGQVHFELIWEQGKLKDFQMMCQQVLNRKWLAVTER